MQVCVVGTGYVGLVTGVCLSYLGHSVTCVDIDQRKIEMLNSGKSPIYEPGLDQLLTLCIQKGLLHFNTDINGAVKQADIIFTAVGTPPLPSGKANLSYVEAVARQIGASLDGTRRRVVVNKSTVPIGSGNWVEMLVKEGLKGNKECEGLKPESLFAVASNPEFLREGSAIPDTFYPDRIVLGSSDPFAIEQLRALYKPLIEQTFTSPPSAARASNMMAVPVVTTDLASAEMIKYAANAFLATKISFANEIANICERVGADVHEVVRGFGLDNRIGPRFLNAGLGWGGSCFGKDVSALIDIAKEYNYEPQMLRATVGINSEQRGIAVQKLQETLKIIKGKTIGLLGLAFKPNTDDLRDAPALTIAERLLEMGAKVKAYDPIANEHCQKQYPDINIEYAENVESLARDCDAIVLVTEWEEFKHLDLQKLKEVMNGNVIIDGRNVLDQQAVRDANFIYRGIGR